MILNWLKARRVISTFLLALLITVSIQFVSVASDHDDGEVNQHSLALTDLYAFRDCDENATASCDNVVLVMNSHPRSLPRVQNFFSSTARYEFHFTRVLETNIAVVPTGAEDIVLRFEFSAPNTTTNKQTITVTAVVDGSASSVTTDSGGTALSTTTLAEGDSSSEVVQSFTLAGATMSLFAGLREDPFYFDVKQYFAVRSVVATDSSGLTASPFNSVTAAEDFAKGYNVNSIVVKVPITFFQSGNTNVSTVDVWETISIPN